MMDWPIHPGAVTRPKPKQHGNAGKPATHVIRRARGDDGALMPDSRLLTSPCWDPLPGTTPVALEDRTGCAWPVTRDSPHLFCNGPKMPGKPYCRHHHSIYRSKILK